MKIHTYPDALDASNLYEFDNSSSFGCQVLGYNSKEDNSIEVVGIVVMNSSLDRPSLHFAINR